MQIYFILYIRIEIKTQATAPCALILGQPFQPISNLLVLVTQDWALAIASLTDLEGAAGKRDTGAPLYECNCGHLSSVRRP